MRKFFKCSLDFALFYNNIATFKLEYYNKLNIFVVLYLDCF